jgi:hypothetical protein
LKLRHLLPPIILKNRLEARQTTPVEQDIAQPLEGTAYIQCAVATCTAHCTPTLCVHCLLWISSNCLTCSYISTPRTLDVPCMNPSAPRPPCCTHLHSGLHIPYIVVFLLPSLIAFPLAASILSVAHANPPQTIALWQSFSSPTLK